MAVQITEEDRKRIPFVFFRLGGSKLSISKSWLGAFRKSMLKSISTNNNGEERACIQCEYCINICPVGLFPVILMKAAILEDIEKLAEHQIQSCVDCNLCSFVCPSKIEVGQLIKNGKFFIKREG